VIERMRKRSLSRVYSISTRKEYLARGIAKEREFIYEIMRLCLVITLTSLNELRKMRSIQGTKEKTTSELSSFVRACRAANRLILFRIKA
jgi:hypothetical protein